MAEEDEIDILGDFSFDSCLAQNTQGIPSGSDRENTVHPQWLLDGTATNWYDFQNRAISSRSSKGPLRVLSGDRSIRSESDMHTSWSPQERELLAKEMSRYGRDVIKISQSIKTKTVAEIQALIEAEYGVNLDTPSLGLQKTNIEHDDIPAVVQEEIVTDDDNMNSVITMVTTGKPTILPRIPLRKKTNRPKNSLLKPRVLLDIKKTNDLIAINPSEILYEDDLIIGSTESIGQELDSADIVSKKLLKNSADGKLKGKLTKKIGNHRRKYSRNFDKSPKPRNSSKDKLRSPGRQRKDSSLSEESKSPKMQIVFSSGHALPVSEGEQVIKIEKKKDSDPESDIDIDVDSDGDVNVEPQSKVEPPHVVGGRTEEPQAFAPVPRRQKKINLDGGGGYTIMHTAYGDLCARRPEPRRHRVARPAPASAPAPLIPCRVYSDEHPAPYTVRLCVSALVAMDTHAHTSRAEVMGLLGGHLVGDELRVVAYRAAAAAAGRTHCEMDPVSQALAAERLRSVGALVCGWHHSHPLFAALPSARDLRSQRALQSALERARRPIVAAITAQHWPPGRAMSQYKCFRVESTPEDPEVGYQFSVKLVPDLTAETLPGFLGELREELRGSGSGGGSDKSALDVDVASDVCPLAKMTYLEKCISSVTHHMISAGYDANEPVTKQLILGLRDIFR